jgi:hypothetical protein
VKQLGWSEIIKIIPPTGDRIEVSGTFADSVMDSIPDNVDQEAWVLGCISNNGKLQESSIKEADEESKYNIVNGTAYDKKTPQAVIDVLEAARQSGQRITLDLGDPNTGKSWGERYDITGRVGRSTGQIKIPILVHNSRSMGGGGILTANIIAIKTSSGNKFLYKHPKYQPYEQE